MDAFDVIFIVDVAAFAFGVIVDVADDIVVAIAVTVIC